MPQSRGYGDEGGDADEALAEQVELPEGYGEIALPERISAGSARGGG